MSLKSVATNPVQRCCGTCRFWVSEDMSLESIIRNRCKKMPICRLNGEVRGAEEMKGCLGWKQAENEELLKRKVWG